MGLGGVPGGLGRRPLLGAALSFSLGIAISGQVGLDVAIPGASLALAFAILAAALARAAPGFSTLGLLLGFGLVGAAVESRQMHARGAPDGEVEWLAEGVVVEPASVFEGRQRAQVRFSRVRSEGTWRDVDFRARVSSEPSPVWPGDRVRVVARFSPPPRNANPGSPDLETRWRASGVVATATVLERQQVALGPPPLLAPAAAAFRASYARLAADAVPAPDARALIRALAVGDRTDLAPALNDEFGASGLAHVLSVSGLHIAVVAAGAYRVLRWLLARSERLLLRWDARALAALAALPATWAYVWVSGGEVPAVRSGLMASAVFLSMAARRDSDAPTSLAAALLTVLAYDPSAMWSVSFQLSFAAVAGLMLLSAPLRALVPIAKPDRAAAGNLAALRRIGESVLGAAIGSLAASLATAPLVAAAFHRASLVAVLSNAVALPVASGVTALAAASAAVLPLGETPAAFLVCAAEPLARALLVLSHAFASLPFASALVAAPSWTFSAAWYGALACLAAWEPGWKFPTRLMIPCAAVLALSVAWRLAGPLLRKGLVVTFLAVGQGDSTVLQLPGGEDVLVDGGGDPTGRFDPGARIVVPALAELGATRLRAAVLSHPHPDHLLGLIPVLEHVSVEELWVPMGLDARLPLVRRLLEVARARSVAIRALARGDRVRVGACTFEALHPLPAPDGSSENDASLVLRASFGSTGLLFPGDVESLGEEALLAGGEPRATVVKVPHHGSRTSSSEAFVSGVRPLHAIFSVGRANRFGFPHAEVLERYRRAGAQLHRTDLDGAITVRSDGVSLQVDHALR